MNSTAVGEYCECHSSGTPTASTAIQASQKSFQPRAMAYVANIEPTKIQASHQKYQRGAGKPAPITLKIHWHNTTPAKAATRYPTRSRAVAQRGMIAGWSEPAPCAFFDSCQRYHP